MTDPLHELVSNAIDLMNPSFVGADPRFEFFHQFRKLWDRGIPVGMGLGHLLLKASDGGFHIIRLGEQGRTDELLAAVLFDDRNDETDRVFRVVNGRLQA